MDCQSSFSRKCSNAIEMIPASVSSVGDPLTVPVYIKYVSNGEHCNYEQNLIRYICQYLRYE